MTEQRRPLFIVGTEANANFVRNLGHEAEVAHNMDPAQTANLAMSIAAQGRTAIIILEDTAATVFSDACAKAGAAFRIVEPDRVSRDMDEDAWAALLDLEEQEALDQQDAAIAEANKRALQRLGVHDAFDVARQLAAGEADRELIPTGISNVDSLLGGGLPMGELIVIGALSSLGKTTFCNQIADHVAASGRPVLFVTCEQSRYELVAMSLSRMLRQTPTRKGGYYVASRAAIQSAKARETWGEPLRNAFYQVGGDYSSRIAPHMHIMEPDGQPTARDIARAAHTLARQTGAVPLVVVDYLQLLAPENDRMDERRAVGANIGAMRRLARDLGAAVILISALNRASYAEGVTMSAFRESSAIEYGSDLMLALEPQGMTERVLKAKGEQQRHEARAVVDDFRDKAIKGVELRVLKNRAGAVPKSGAALTFEAACSYFYPDTSEAGTAPTTHAARRIK